MRYGKVLGLVALGGLLGANLRYAFGAVAGEALLATVTVNAIGCFCLGLLLFDARADELLTKQFRYVLGTGFFASFTTYSTFIADIALTEPILATGYLVASYITGFTAVLASRWFIEKSASSLIGPPPGGDR